MVGWESSVPRAGAGSSRREQEGGGVCAHGLFSANVMRSKLQREREMGMGVSAKKKTKPETLYIMAAVKCDTALVSCQFNVKQQCHDF